jgi:hypothetical protein
MMHKIRSAFISNFQKKSKKKVPQNLVIRHKLLVVNYGFYS